MSKRQFEIACGITAVIIVCVFTVFMHYMIALTGSPQSIWFIELLGIEL